MIGQIDSFERTRPIPVQAGIRNEPGSRRSAMCQISRHLRRATAVARGVAHGAWIRVRGWLVYVDRRTVREAATRTGTLSQLNRNTHLRRRGGRGRLGHSGLLVVPSVVQHSTRAGIHPSSSSNRGGPEKTARQFYGERCRDHAAAD